MPTNKDSLPRDDGGPAFPLDEGAYMGQDRTPGMSLRDYFAGQALAGMLASPPLINRAPDKVNHAGWARNAYQFADAMIVERTR